ncbi:MAG: hypothetical protein IJB72_00240 [Clostridia bacterium]|nr:hypothetical protein [Clostridia bacterium]MBR2954001.1 hypothetical protein [Clostridia bacterium]
MKKYVKPLISFFELNLSTSISTGCDIYSNNAEYQCPVQVPGQPGLTIFQKGTCTAYSPSMQDTICYHVPLEDMTVFES